MPEGAELLHGATLVTAPLTRIPLQRPAPAELTAMLANGTEVILGPRHAGAAGRGGTVVGRRPVYDQATNLRGVQMVVRLHDPSGRRVCVLSAMDDLEVIVNTEAP